MGFGHRDNIAERREEDPPAAVGEGGLETGIAEDALFVPAHFYPAVIEHRFLGNEGPLSMEEGTESLRIIGRSPAEEAHHRAIKAKPWLARNSS
jgi:hypothetical protein